MSYSSLFLKIIFFLLFIVLIIFQLSFVNTSSVNYLNLVFISLLFFLFTKHPYRLLIFSLTSGFIFDLYSQFSFGSYLIILGLVLVITYLLYQNVFTHHSQVAIIGLTVFATISFNLFLFLLTKIIFLLNLNDYVHLLSFKSIILQIIINSLSLLILFYARKSIFHISR